MKDDDVLIATVLDEAALTIEQICAACGVSRAWIEQRVREGLLTAAGEAPVDWRFGGREIRRVREMYRLECHFDAVPELAALVVDLHEQIEALRARLALLAREGR